MSYETGRNQTANEQLPFEAVEQDEDTVLTAQTPETVNKLSWKPSTYIFGLGSPDAGDYLDF